MINIRDLGAKGDGSSDDTGAFQAAINSATHRATLFVPPGRYMIDELTCTGANAGKTLFLVGEGKPTLVSTTQNILLQWANTNITPTSGSAIDRALGDLDPRAATSTNTYVSRITFSGGHAFAVGDLVRVVADDVLGGAAAGTDRERIGQFAYVGAVSGNDIYLTAVLREHQLYTTAIRVAKVNDATFGIRGIRFDVADPSSISRAEAALQIAGAIDPRFEDLEFVACYDDCIRVSTCFGYYVGCSSFYRAMNNADRGTASKKQDGVGVQDSASEYGRILGCTFMDCRHAVSTYSFPTATGSSLDRYGRSFGTVVSGCTAFGCSNVPFQTHEFAMGWQFDNCKAYGTFRGSQSSGAGFGARGINTSFSDCEAVNCHRGFYIVQQTDKVTKGVRLHNCRAIGCSASGFEVETANDRILEIEVTDSSFECTGDSTTGARAAKITSGDVKWRNVALKHSGSGTKTLELSSQVSSSLKANLTLMDCSLDVSGVSETNHDGVYLGDAFCTVEGTRLLVTLGSATELGTGALLSSLSTSKGTVLLRDVVLDFIPTNLVSNLSDGSAYSFRKSDNSDSSAWTTMSPFASLAIDAVANGGGGTIAVTTFVNHQLATNDVVAISGVLGATNVNGVYRITIDGTDPKKFYLQGTTTVSGTYTDDTGTATYLKPVGTRDNISPKGISNYLDEDLYIVFTPGASNLAYAHQKLPSGAFIGQRLHLLTTFVDRTNSLTIRHGTTDYNAQLPEARDWRLVDNQGAHLVWSGSTWRSDDVNAYSLALGGTLSTSSTIPLTAGFVNGSASSAAITLSLPAAHLCIGQVKYVRKSDGTANTVTVASTVPNVLYGGANTVILDAINEVAAFLAIGDNSWVSLFKP